MKKNPPPAWPWPRAVRRFAAVALPVLAMLAGGSSARAEGEAAALAGGGAGAGAAAGAWAGVFAGSARADGRVVDVDGFSYSGRSGHAVDYDDNGFTGGALAGRKVDMGGVPLRVEVDAAFGGTSAKTNRIDPRYQPPDETVRTKFRWVVTARAGVERAAGSATLFAAAGLAAARIENSLTDLDAYRDERGEWVLLPNGRAAQRVDPDDSFRGGSTELGWVVGAGVEAPLADAWTLRLDASYLDFGRGTYYANRSGDDRCCGAGTPRRPVTYRIENRLTVVRLALLRRFGGGWRARPPRTSSPLRPPPGSAPRDGRIGGVESVQIGVRLPFLEK